MKIQTDIISDIVCPWCAVGYYQLAKAAEICGIALDITWHPYELAPDMPDEGENLYEFLANKFNQTIEQGDQTRAHITALGKEVGFAFNYTSDQMRYNTFRAHQLIHWAQPQGQGHVVNLALFEANFTKHENINDIKALANIAAAQGLDYDQAIEMLENKTHAKTLREEEQFWLQQGIRSVPSMIFEKKYLISGAQGVEGFKRFLAEMTKNKK